MVLVRRPRSLPASSHQRLERTVVSAARKAAEGPVEVTSTRRLRTWQEAALRAYAEAGRPRDFLVTATPGAGKTTFALTLGRALLAARLVERVIVVCPTDHLRTQWADAASEFGVPLDAA